MVCFRRFFSVLIGCISVGVAVVLKFFVPRSALVLIS